MDSIGIRELRQNASEYIRRVRAGESIRVTDRGEPVAVLSPVTELSALERLRRSGDLTPAPASLDDLPPPLVIPGFSPSQVLDRQRRDR